MEDETDQPAPKSSLAGMIVVGALLGFGALLFLANFSGQVSDPGRGNRANPFGAEAPRGKAKGPMPPVQKLDAEDLLVTGEPIERATAPEGAKNLVLVVPTALRRDHTEPYGAPEGLTPRLQDLAAQGVRFADLVSASPYSRTAGVAWLTGRHAVTLDMVEPSKKPNQRVLSDEATTFVEQLRAAGWGTYGVSANLNLNTDTGLAQGYDKYRNSQKNSFHPRARIPGGKVVDEALGLLDARSEEEQARPFFLMVNLVDAHPPFLVRPEDKSAFDPGSPNAGYRALVHRVDSFVGKLVDGLQQRGHTPDSDTIVVILGDHGEGLSDPEHHGEVHGRVLYESSVLVPWIVAGPDLPKNQVVGGVASHTDVAPTLLELLGLPAPEGIDGQSWAAQVRGDKPRTDREVAFSDTWYFNANRASIWTDSRQCQKDFGSPEIDDAFGTGCFDRRTDPDFTNLITDDELMKQLDAWRAEVAAAVTASDGEGEEDGEG